MSNGKYLVVIQSKNTNERVSSIYFAMAAPYIKNYLGFDLSHADNTDSVLYYLKENTSNMLNELEARRTMSAKELRKLKNSNDGNTNRSTETLNKLEQNAAKKYISQMKLGDADDYISTEDVQLKLFTKEVEVNNNTAVVVADFELTYSKVY